MRIYGLHSGRNNPARYIARSFVRNSVTRSQGSRKSEYTKGGSEKHYCCGTDFSIPSNSKSTITEETASCSTGTAIVYVILLLILTILVDWGFSYLVYEGDKDAFIGGLVVLLIPSGYLTFVGMIAVSFLVGKIQRRISERRELKEERKLY